MPEQNVVTIPSDSEIADTPTSSLPPGYTLDAPSSITSSSAPASTLPPGYTLDKPSTTPDFNLYDTVLGPNTMLGSPVPQGVKDEGAAVMDIVHGDVRKGLGEIWKVENPVKPGSYLEKAIQHVDPNFHGNTGAPIERATSKPPADFAQFIDVQKHPVEKALTEVVQSLLTPDNIAIAAATGGTGLVQSAASRLLLGRLVAGGFSLTQVADAYAHVEGFKKAFDSGDKNTAAYELTHAIASGALAVLTGTHAVKGGQGVAAKTSDAIADTKTSLEQHAADQSAVKANADESAAPQKAKDEFYKAYPPSPRGRASYSPSDYDVIRPQLEAERAKVDTEGQAGDLEAARNVKQNIENQASANTAKFEKENPDARVKPMDAEIRKALEGRSEDKEFVNDGMKALENYPVKEDITPTRADKIRREMNARNAAINNGLPVDQYNARVTNPAYAAREAYADLIRDRLYGVEPDENGQGGTEGMVPENRGLRQQYGAAKKIAAAIESKTNRGSQVIRGSKEESLPRKIAGKVAKSLITAGGAGLGLATGIPGAETVGGVGGFELGTIADRAIQPENLTRDELSKSSFDRTAQQKSTPTPAGPRIPIPASPRSTITAGAVPGGEQKKPVPRSFGLPEGYTLDSPMSELSHDNDGSKDISSLLDSAAQENGIPPTILYAQARQESGMRQDVTSPKGARGVMQLMPKTAKELDVDPDDVAQNIRGGATYLKQMHEKFGDWSKALAAYNAGPERVEEAIAYYGVDWFNHMPAETKHYVRAIMAQNLEKVAQNQ